MTISRAAARSSPAVSGMGLPSRTALARAGRQCRRRLLCQRGRRADRAMPPAYPDADEIDRGPLSPGSAWHEGLRRPSRRARHATISNRFVAEAEAACGPADILVNAAGTTAEQPVCGHSDELWLKDHRHQPHRRLPHDPRRAARHDRARLGPHRQHRLDRGHRRLEGQSGLLRLEGRPARPDPLRGAGRCAARRHLRHDQPDLGRDRTDAPQCRAGRRARGQGPHARRKPWPKSPRRTRSSACCSRTRSRHLRVFLCGDAAKGITMENIQITGGALW